MPEFQSSARHMTCVGSGIQPEFLTEKQLNKPIHRQFLLGEGNSIMHNIATRPGHKLVFADSGKPVVPGCTLRAVDPSGGPYVWHLDGHHAGEDEHGHRVMVSRHHPKLGRVHRSFHPRVFGLVIEIDVVWYRDVRHVAHRARVRFGDWFMAGLIALVPLAFFERFHWAEDITQGFAALGSIFGFDAGGPSH